MKQVLVKSVEGAFQFVMDHYYPVGLEEEAGRKDTYAIISIQDTHMGGFGVTLNSRSACTRSFIPLFSIFLPFLFRSYI